LRAQRIDKKRNFLYTLFGEDELVAIHLARRLFIETSLRRKKLAMTKIAAAPPWPMDVESNVKGQKLDIHRVRFDCPSSDRDPVPQAPRILHC
jgi:hypothetical protein